MITKTDKKAFTLIELIFVIVIIGIMAGVASSAFKTNYLIDDTNFIVAKIKEAQFSAIGYEHLGLINTPLSDDDYKNGCININKNKFAENDTNYKLHSTFSGSLNDTIICFDSKGRVHTDNFDGTLLNASMTLTLSYSSKDKNITIQPITGYVSASQ